MRFDRSLVSDLDEPVQRFFTHAIRDGAALSGGVRVRMAGRIKVGTWLPFTAEQTADGRSWGNAGEQTFRYIPCGCDVHAERRFGDLLVPSRLTVGWWFDTPRYAPFFTAHINHSTPY
jgi:hypothetical protein